MILNDEFELLQSYTNYCIVMKVAVAALKEFDGKQPCMGNVYIIMWALCQHVVALQNTTFNIPGHLVKLLEVALKIREALVFSNLYYANALLNP